MKTFTAVLDRLTYSYMYVFMLYEINECKVYGAEVVFYLVIVYTPF